MQLPLPIHDMSTLTENRLFLSFLCKFKLILDEKEFKQYFNCVSHFHFFVVTNFLYVRFNKKMLGCVSYSICSILFKIIFN